MSAMLLQRCDHQAGIHARSSSRPEFLGDGSKHCRVSQVREIRGVCRGRPGALWILNSPQWAQALALHGRYPYRHERSLLEPVLAFPISVRAFPILVRGLPNHLGGFPNWVRVLPNSVRGFPNSVRDFPILVRGFPISVRGFPMGVRVLPKRVRGIFNGATDLRFAAP